MNLVAQFSGQQNILAIPRPFIHCCGDITSALFLSQLLYWTDKAKRKDGYVFKSYREWEEEIGLSESQIRRATVKLKTEGVLETKLMKANGAPTLHYRIIKNQFEEWILNKLQNGILTNIRIDSEESSDSSNIDYNIN